MTKHKHYELCYRAHLNTSFHPEKRAEYYCQGFDAAQDELRALGASEETLTKSERLFVAWMHAKSNCLSSMITGPARFPVARAQKATNSEENRSREYYDHFERVKKAINREKYLEENPYARPISNDDSDALERLKAKLQRLEEERERNNQINRIVRKAPRAECTLEKVKALEELGISAGLITKLFQPGQVGGKGIPSWVNQNLGGNIQSIKQRIASLEAMAKKDSVESDLCPGVKFVTDTEAMRVYFEFDGKPETEVRQLLKSSGFRWTPSKGHWGRKLTGNAQYAANKVAQALKVA